MSKSILEILKENFPDQNFELEKVNYGGLIHAFFIKPSNEKLLNDTWENIRNMIGVYFQSKLDSEFDIWNIYLFFITDVQISKDLKHKIEHDTLSSRKIVIDGHEKMKEPDFKNFLFSEHITNDNLNISISEKLKVKFDKNKMLSTILDKIDLSKIKRNKEEVIGNALNQLEKSVRDEI
jgi:hypothetical protein